MSEWLATLGLAMILAGLLLYLIERRRRVSFFTEPPKRDMEPPFEKVSVQDDMLTAVGLATYKTQKSIMDAPPPGAMREWMDQQPKAPPVEYRAPAPAPHASPAGIIPTGGGVRESQLFDQGSADRGERRLIRRLIPDHSVPR